MPGKRGSKAEGSAAAKDSDHRGGGAARTRARTRLSEKGPNVASRTIATDDEDDDDNTVSMRNGKRETSGDVSDGEYLPCKPINAKSQQEASAKIKVKASAGKKRANQAESEDDRNNLPMPKKTRYGKDAEDAFAAKDSTPSSLTLPEELSQMRACVESLTTKFHNAQQAFAVKQADIGYLKHMLNQKDKAIEELKIRNANLQSRNQEWESRNNVLEDRLKQLEKTVTTQRQRIVELLNERRVDTSGCITVADDTINSKWLQLVYNIQNMCNTYLLRTEPLPSWGEHRETGLGEVMRRIVKMPELRIYLLQHHIWAYLLSNMFQSQGQVWGGMIGQNFAAYCSRVQGILIEANREFDLMGKLSLKLAQTATHIDEAYGINERAIEYHLNELTTMLVLFLGTERPGIVAEVEGQVRAMLNEALQLQIMFMKSRAYFKLTLPSLGDTHWPSLPTAEMMDAYFRDPNIPDDLLRFNFMVTPILEKFGDAGGENFDAQMVLSKGRYVAQFKNAMDTSSTTETESATDATNVAGKDNTETAHGNESERGGVSYDDDANEAQAVSLSQIKRTAQEEHGHRDAETEHSLAGSPSKLNGGKGKPAVKAECYADTKPYETARRAHRSRPHSFKEHSELQAGIQGTTSTKEEMDDMTQLVSLPSDAASGQGDDSSSCTVVMEDVNPHTASRELKEVATQQPVPVDDGHEDGKEHDVYMVPSSPVTAPAAAKPLGEAGAGVAQPDASVVGTGQADKPAAKPRRPKKKTHDMSSMAGTLAYARDKMANDQWKDWC